MAFQAHAVPRYSARYEQNCALCHVNPTGGGMRAAYASQELVPKELAWAPGSPTTLAEIDPMIARHVGIGTDFREVYLAESPGSSQPVSQGFFQMQGDIYLSFQLDPRFTLYYDRGMSNTYEAFALGYVLPWTGYVKTGRFVPSYGWRFDDHTMFVRGELGFFPPANSDVGVEVGFAPKRFDVQFALLNGNRGATQDNDRRVAAAASGLFRFRAGPVAAAAGLSGYHQPGKLADLDMGGTRGSVAWGDFTWIAEADLIRRDPAGAGATTGLVTSHQLAWEIRQGLELIGTYDFYDPDRHLETGATSRWGGGVHVLLRSFLALEALFRSTTVEPGPSLSRKDFDEGVLQVHALY